jgi:hypothetical protein
LHLGFSEILVPGEFEYRGKKKEEGERDNDRGRNLAKTPGDGNIGRDALTS